MTTRTIHRLNDRKVKTTTEPGRLHDGGGLYFQVTERGHRSWEFRYEHLKKDPALDSAEGKNKKKKKKRRTMGLGGYPNVSLSKARELHKEAAALVRDGVDPIDARNANRQTAAASLTVMAAAEAYISAMEVDWKTERYPDQIRERLNRYVKPVIGDMAIADIGHAEALLVLAPIWNKIRTTAKRIRKHLEGIVDAAVAGGHRKNEVNPFEAKRLMHTLSFAKREATHHASLPYEQAPEFFAKLRGEDGIKARALEFVMLNAVRVADVVGGGKAHSEPMKWAHVDLDAKLWTIPDTKMGKPHVVPLSDAAMAVLAQMHRHRDPNTDFVFPGAVRGTVISDATLRYLISDMGYKGLTTTHGLRATFKTWASEVTDFDKPVVEMALAHAQSALDQAYQRGALLDKRRRLMAAWADYLEGRVADQSNNVVALRA